MSDGAAWNSTLMVDRYWSPSPNHANQWEFSIAEPQTLGFSSHARKGSEEAFRPAQMIDLFSPPPLMAAFHRDGEWASVGIGAQPGWYRFPALEYSGSRYAGAAWWVDYLGYQTMKTVPAWLFHRSLPESRPSAAFSRFFTSLFLSEAELLGVKCPQEGGPAGIPMIGRPQQVEAAPYYF